jgi:hypothetical protein
MSFQPTQEIMSSLLIFWRLTSETAVRHGFSDIKVGLDACLAKRRVKANRVGEKQVARAGSKVGRRKSFAQIAQKR